MHYDLAICGTGLFGAVVANEAMKKGKKVILIDKRSHIGGNIYTEKKDNIDIHKYGAHIFHTSDKKIWDYINSFATFNNFINSPIANYKGKLYPMPFNMNTFYAMWGTVTPEEAEKKINEEIAKKVAEKKAAEAAAKAEAEAAANAADAPAEETTETPAEA